MIKVIQGDSLNLTFTVTEGAELIEELWFTSKCLNISKKLTPLSETEFLISFSSEETIQFEEEAVTYDITAILKDNQISTVVYNDVFIIYKKENKL